MRVALVTFDRLPQLSEDDQRLIPEFARLGLKAEPAVWSDPTIEWSKFDTVILRSPWDYHLRHEDFLEWISKLQNLGVSLWNPPELLRWNLDKHYLKDLDAKGFKVPPTIWVHNNTIVDLSAIIRDQGWRRAVAKPRISASGHNTVLAKTEAGGEAGYFSHKSGGMVQPYLEEVETEGEWSLLFFNKNYSHAVLKRPKSGEFRVQAEHGGSADPADPPRKFIEVASDLLDSITGPLLFARVDGIPVQGEFTLIELELIEPYLFFEADPLAPRRFCEAFIHLSKG